MTTDDDQKRADDMQDGGDDDLLSTIRQMVSEEAARDLVDHPGHLPPGAEPNSETDDAAKKSDAPKADAKPGRLVLGKLTRVSEGEPPSNVTHLPPQSEPAANPALRGMIGDLVREEVANAFDEAFELRLRDMVKTELAEYLARARRGR